MCLSHLIHNICHSTSSPNFLVLDHIPSTCSQYPSQLSHLSPTQQVLYFLATCSALHTLVLVSLRSYTAYTSASLAFFGHTLPPVISLHLVQVILILCPPLLLLHRISIAISVPRYLNLFTCFSSTAIASTTFTFVSSFLSATSTSDFCAFTFSPPFLKALFQLMTFLCSSSVVVISAISSAKISSHGTNVRILTLSVSTIVINKNGLNADPWCSPTLKSNASVSPYSVLILSHSRSLACRFYNLYWIFWYSSLSKTTIHYFSGHSIIPIQCVFYRSFTSSRRKVTILRHQI